MLDVLMHDPLLVASNKTNSYHTTGEQQQKQNGDMEMLAKTWASVQEIGWKQRASSAEINQGGGEIMIIRKSQLQGRDRGT